MKLMVQIPCYNEAGTLPEVLRDIPKSIEGISVIEVLIIDDGSTDETVAVARQHGVQHIVSHKANKGLARSFQSGIERCIELGADIIVNTDGDNQYAGSSIPDLVRPIVEGKADVVIGDRQPGRNTDFSLLKRLLQRLGSAVVRHVARVDVGDAVSGFRAYSRDAALKINVMTSFSYTTETLIHVGQQGLLVKSVHVDTNPVTRPSRLFKSMGHFIKKQVATILRSYAMYRPLHAFSMLGATMILIGLIPVLRFLYFYFIGEGDGKIQSLVLGSTFLVMGYITFVAAIIGDTISINRRLIEQLLERVRKIEIDFDDKK
ncbi:MAG: glycosyl transferase [Alphaproteobacteria bacterium]|nr:glycosyl transferase [Alphaproteobacteria bacterium]MAS46851.1 glycosyl transferase [Alphaproteobacteria bacterium]MAX94946.1 glycosyl transferase [Alphaproteobacteria bacterium]MBN53601.1 glycosyl transferase [Alphaproteobacteria bacterium]OUT41585.1 MAG: glycosyl transferase [Micavibrio sp. TMED2]|tara:strand:+ start:10681 stop:11634 length:954 start_codon:yes stop_codon:yes gene_type:complete